MNISCVDLFCGAVGLINGFVKEGLPVVAGIDLGAACRCQFEQNNKSIFIEKGVCEFASDELIGRYSISELRIFAGCAPC